ncbi:DNA polymerase delta small subunit [Scheffersomyces amazonensis]|uniref:DNA polymerase delta small subunit n=1 Tax=Scheffersomyces amazonensis TaxID=1078765 RepID=UPI00315D865D
MTEAITYMNNGITVGDHGNRNHTVPIASDEFKLDSTTRKYDKQYYSMYQYRFQHLKDRIYDNALKKWGDGTRKIDGQTIIKQDKILDITSGQLCWVIGTIFSDLKNKLNILEDVDHGTDDVLPKAPDSYVGADDDISFSLMIEDESGRAILHNDDFLNKNILVSGCIVAVLGIELQAGIFEIMDVVYPEFAPQPSLTTRSNSGNKIAIISGLNVDYQNNDIKLDLLRDYLTGELGSEKDHQLVQSITKLIIAGNSVRPLKVIENQDFTSTNNYGSKIASRFDSQSIDKFDKWLTELLPSLPISIMPGNNDIAEICLPQQALHKSTFRHNYQYLSDPTYLQIWTNPQWIEIDGITMLGTSGQNVQDILRYLKDQDHSAEKILTIMKSHMKWQNFMPTAPDTLYCYPYDEFDPFILEKKTPHIYFVGNQAEYGSEILEFDGGQIRIISVPKFEDSGQVVIVDLDTLSTEVITVG